MTIQTKFFVQYADLLNSTSVHETPVEKVHLTAVYPDDEYGQSSTYLQHGDGKFGRQPTLTPILELWISNPNSQGFFKPGYVYNITFEKDTDYVPSPDMLKVFYGLEQNDNSSQKDKN